MTTANNGRSKLKRLTLTDDLQYLVAMIRRAEDHYRAGRESRSVVDIPKLALADAVLRAVDAREKAVRTRVERLSRVPKARPAVVGVVPSRAKRRRA